MENPLDGGITTDVEFETALSEIVGAEEGDVSVEGGWVCEAPTGARWDLVITEVVPADD